MKEKELPGVCIVGLLLSALAGVTNLLIWLGARMDWAAIAGMVLVYHLARISAETLIGEGRKQGVWEERSRQNHVPDSSQDVPPGAG